MLRFPGYVSVCPASVNEEDATMDWLASGQFNKPYRLVGYSGEKLRTYQKLNDVGYIRDKVGGGREVRTIDVKTQKDGPRLTLDEWCEYWRYKTGESRAQEDDFGEVGMLVDAPEARQQPRHGKRSLNVVSLSLANSPLEEELQAPDIVQQSDLVRLFWPKDQAVHKPKAELYGLMSPAKCYTDWHVDFGGSSVWYNVVRGKKYFALAPPTEHNLKSFAAWANSPQQEKVNLLVYLKDPVLYELKAGDTMIIPGGWPHAVYTPSDSIAVGGNFLHPFNLSLQLEVWRLENALGVPMSCRFPAFKSLMWYAAKSIARLGRGGSPPAQAERPLQFAVRLPRQETDPGTASGSDCASKSAFPVLKLKVKPVSNGTSEVNGLRVRLPLSPRADQGRRLAVKLLLSHNPSNCLRILLSVLKNWIQDGSEAQACVPVDLPSPQELLGDLEGLLEVSGLLNCHGTLYEVDYGTSKLEEPQFVPTGGGAGSGHCKEKVTPLVKKLNSSTLSSPCGLGATKKVKKANGVRDRLKKKLGMR
mmetsp:Transcript_4351/g.12787  ORF Transcript_4351/g.12787 Transcript_4351/m.12787 type:complete len:531 (+) Transcript_4351:639-2231(+)